MVGTDARDRTFGMEGPIDLLAKLEWEAGRLYASLQDADDPDAPRYFALNAATTAWHILDWVVADLDERSLWPISTPSFRAANRSELFAIAQANRSLAACSQMANAWKHRSLDRSFKAGYRTSDETVDFEFAGKPASMRFLRVRFPGGLFDVRIILHETIDWWATTLRILGYSV